MKTNWRLPKGVDELLPPDAWALEMLRRDVLDLFVSWGFDYIEPPVIEYLDALLVGGGEDLDLQTLKVVDQVTGKQLGVRSDMTAQAVRVDAHSRVTDGVQRLCYAGPVVFANPRIAQTSRVPFKAGAEIFGSDSLDADAEAIALMLAAVQAAGVQSPVLLLGHMGIYLSLVAELAEEVDQEELFQALQRKSQSDIEGLLPSGPIAEMIKQLPMLMGGVDVIDRAKEQLKLAPESVASALSELADLVDLISAQNTDVEVRIDIAELCGYGYHNGPVYSVFHPEHGQSLAQGGRYDGVGSDFGRARPATGFDMDLKLLLGASQEQDVVFAPYVSAGVAEDQEKRAKLAATIARLRDEGKRVQSALHAGEEVPTGCRRTLTWVQDEWRLVE